MHIKRHLIRQCLISTNTFLSTQSFLECCASAKCSWIRFSVEVARQKLHMDLCPHVSFCFAAGYRHHRGCTELICCSLPSCAEENTEHILSEDGPSLKVLGMSGNLMVCCCSLAAVPCHLLFAGRDRLPTAACLSCSGLTTACPNGSSRKYLKKKKY